MRDCRWEPSRDDCLHWQEQHCTEVRDPRRMSDLLERGQGLYFRRESELPVSHPSKECRELQILHFTGTV